MIQSLGQYRAMPRSSGLMVDSASSCMTFTKSPNVTQGRITLASCFLVSFGLYQNDWIELLLSREMETLRDISPLTKPSAGLQSVIDGAAKVRDAS